MARRLIWSARAQRDLSDILDHIAAEAPINARRVARRIIGRVESLSGQPGQGRRLPEVGVDPEL